MKAGRLTFILTALMLMLPHRTYSQGAEFLLYAREYDRLQGALQLDMQRRQLIGQLMEILNSTNAPEVKAETVIVLGEYRATEAVPVLVAHLEWDDVIPRAHRNGHMLVEDEEFVTGPVIGALCKIGSPAIPALMDRIAGTNEKNITMKCVAICTLIEGQDITQFRLQQSLKKETDKKKKAGIQAGLDALKHVADFILMYDQGLRP
jgi:hypothetical protein